MVSGVEQVAQVREDIRQAVEFFTGPALDLDLVLGDLEEAKKGAKSHLVVNSLSQAWNEVFTARMLIARLLVSLDYSDELVRWAGDGNQGEVERLMKKVSDAAGQLTVTAEGVTKAVGAAGVLVVRASGDTRSQAFAQVNRRLADVKNWVPEGEQRARGIYASAEAAARE